MELEEGLVVDLRVLKVVAALGAVPCEIWGYRSFLMESEGGVGVAACAGFAAETSRATAA